MLPGMSTHQATSRQMALPAAARLAAATKSINNTLTAILQHVRRSACLLGVVLTFLGCADEKAQAPPIQNPTGNDPADHIIELTAVDYEQLTAYLHEQRGNVVVLDLWNTSCEPCLTALPDLAELARDYSGQPVVCVTVNNDYTGAAATTPQDSHDKVLSMLKTLEIDVKNFLSTVPDRQLYQQPLFKENRVYTVPAVLVIDPSGENVTKFGGADEDSPYGEVREHVQALLDSA